MKTIFLRFALLIISFITGLSAFSQHYPVKVDPQVITPSVFLSDYQNMQNFLVKVQLQDLTKEKYKMRLKMKVQGEGIEMMSTEGIVIELNGGQIYFLSDYDLSMLISDDLAVISGDPADKNKLKPGEYNFSFEAYDVEGAQVPISNSATDFTIAIVTVNEPPLLNLPLNGSQVGYPAGTQNIMFSWTPRTFINVAGQEIYYRIKMVRVDVDGMVPNDLINSSLATNVASDIAFSTHFYQLTEAEPGDTYAWQVQAYEVVNGEESTARFTGDGMSEVYTFTVEENCPVITPIEKPEIETVPETGQKTILLAWNDDPGHQLYQVEYRKFGSSSEWTMVQTTENSLTLGNEVLAEGETYEFQISVRCRTWQPAVYGGTFSLEAEDCPAPDPIFIDKNDDSGIVLSWESIPSAVSYQVVYYGDEKEVKELMADPVSDKTICNLPALSERSSAKVQITATCKTGKGIGTELEITEDQTGVLGPCALPKPLEFSAFLYEDGPKTDETVFVIMEWSTIEGAYKNYTITYWLLNNPSEEFTLESTLPKTVAENIKPDVEYGYNIEFHCGGSQSVKSPDGLFKVNSSVDDNPNIIPGTADCFPPAIVTAEARDIDEARFEWEKVSDAEEYQLFYAVQGSDKWEHYTTTGKSVTRKGLQENAVYEYKIRVLCNSQFSIYSDIGTVDLSQNTKNENCDTVLNFTVLKEAQNEIKLGWDLELDDEGNPIRTGYKLTYIEDGQTWDEPYTEDLMDMNLLMTEHLDGSTIEFTVQELSPGTAYLFKMQGICNGDEAQENTPVKAETGSGEPKGDCEGDDFCDRTSTEPIEKIVAGDEIMVADYKLIVTEATPFTTSEGKKLWKGNGSAEAPFFGMNENVSLAATFDSLFVNDKSCVAGGNVNIDSIAIQLLDSATAAKIKAAAEEVSKIIDDINQIIDDSKKFLSEAEKRARAELDKTQGGGGVGMPVDGNLGERVSGEQDLSSETASTSADGNSVTFGGITFSKSKLPALVKDKNGNVFQVNADESVVNVGKYSDDESLKDLQKKNPDNSKYAIDFEENSQQTYGFDKFRDGYANSSAMEYHYLKLGETYYSAKAITPGATDVVDYKVTKGEIDEDKLKFVNREGFVFNVSGNTLTLPGGPAKDAQEVMAVYEDDGKKIVIGALLLPSYPILKKKVVIIPTSTEQDITEDDLETLKEYLNAAFGQAGIYYEVELDNSIKDSWCGEGEGCGEITASSTGLLNNDYTEDEAEVIENYIEVKGDEINIDDAYIFVVVNGQNTGGDEGTMQGRMNFGKQFGFLFGIKSKFSDYDGRTLAHEIAHGAYSMRHIYDEMYLGESAKTSDYLMSYSSDANAIDLNKLEWDITHNPGKKWGILAKDDDQKAYYTDSEEIQLFVEDFRIAYALDNLSMGDHVNQLFERIIKYYNSTQNKSHTWQAYGDVTFPNGLEINFSSFKQYPSVNPVGSELKDHGLQYKSAIKTIDQSGVKYGVYEFSSKREIENLSQDYVNKQKFRNLWVSIRTTPGYFDDFEDYLFPKSKNEVIKTITDLTTEIVTVYNEKEGGNCDAAELLDKLPYEIYKALDFDTRKGLLKCKISESIVDNEDEEIIIKLIETIPEEEISSLFDYLKTTKVEGDIILARLLDYKVHDEGGDDNFTRLVVTLRDMYYKTPEFAESFMIYYQGFVNNTEGFLNTVASWEIQSDVNLGALRIKSADFTADGKIKIQLEELYKIIHNTDVMWGDGISYFYQDYGNGETYDPFQLIAFVNNSNVGLVNTGIGSGTGSVCFVPAFVAKYAAEKKSTERVYVGVEIAVEIATLATTGFSVALVKNLSRFRRAFLYFESINSYINITICLNDAPQSVEFKKAVEYYQIITALISVGDLVYSSTSLVDIARGTGNITEMTENAIQTNRALLASTLDEINRPALTSQKHRQLYDDLRSVANALDNTNLPVYRLDDVGSSLDGALAINHDKVSRIVGSQPENGTLIIVEGLGDYSDFSIHGSRFNDVDNVAFYRVGDEIVMVAPGFCFSGETQVLSNTGKKQIKDIEVGDEVSSYNQHLKKTVFNKVSKLFKRTTKKITKLAVAGTMLLATPEHQVYANSAYREIQTLEQGDTLVDHNGNYQFVESVETIDTSLTVYNFEVENTHNYYAGELGLLVHNSCASLTATDDLCQLARVVEKLDGLPCNINSYRATLLALENSPALRSAFHGKLADLLTKEEIGKFIDDFALNKDAIKKFVNDPKLVESWKYVSDLKVKSTSKLTQDIELVEVVHRQRNNGIVDKIGSDKYNDIIKNYAGQCKGCDAPHSGSTEAVKHLPPHDEMLSNLETFVNKHQGKDGFDKVINDLKSTEPRKQKGAEFISRILKDQDGVSAFEFQYLDDYDNTADFVLSGTKVDGKSWGVTGSIDKIGGWNLSKQLKDYFKDGNFEQWFDYSRFKKSTNSNYNSMSKADATKHIKEQYQKLFQKQDKAQELFDYMGSAKFEERFGDGIDNVSDFLEYVASDITNDALFGFVKVK